ncbi:lysophospholipase VolA [Geomonas sp. Red276]
MKLVTRFLVILGFLLAIACSSEDHQQSGALSTNQALFDPTTSTVPLPNVLATAMAANPLTSYTNPLTGATGARPANTPMNPLEALAYVNLKEVGGTNAVSGLNAPIYIRFGQPLDAASVTAATIKVFQVTGDSASPLATENNPLTFTDVSGMFTYQYAAGSTEVFLFPNFPLQPAARYLYVVTSGVKDAATGKPVMSSTYFDALKSTIPLVGPLAALEPIRANAMSGTNIQLSGYAKVMNDLITASATTGIANRADIALMGRFITTAAGYVAPDATQPATVMPVESALRAFAAGTNLPGGLPGKTWVNGVTNTQTIPAATYWTGAGAPGTPPAGLASVTIGSINSADLSMDPVVVAANSGTMDLTGVTGADNPAAGVVQPYRSGANLVGYYHVPRTIPFIYLAPAAPNGKLVIFQHGITGQKEQVLTVAQTLTGAGYAVVAIDLPLHGALAVPGHSNPALWGQDFMAVGAPLATRSNIQQAAFNLDRLEISLRTGALVAAGVAAAPPTEISYVGLSLGSIVGTYYLAGNTTLSTSVPPYTQATLNNDMKGFLSVPGGRLAYLIKESPAFSGSINAGLASVGINVGTPTYNQFFLLTQTVVDPADPASVTTPLASGLPSRLSGRVVMQEAVGDQVIPNNSTRYLGNALGGRGVLGAAGATVAPGFDQLAYLSGRVPAPFMYTIAGGQVVPKKQAARAVTAAGSTPSEGYFQFDQTGIGHGFLIDNSTPANTALAQLQMAHYLLEGAVVDPTTAGGVSAGATIPVAAREIAFPRTIKILAH